MLPLPGIVLCLAFVIGLLSTAISWGVPGIVLTGTGAAILRWLATRTPGLPFAWRRGPGAWLWLTAVFVGLFANFYLHSQIPYPGAQDVSRVVDRLTNPAQELTVLGEVKTLPRLTRSQKAQFQLQVQQVDSDVVNGKLYVTVPQPQAKDLHPGQKVRVSGFLYRPPRASVPKGFDFAEHLQRQGIFAGLVGQQLRVIDQGSSWGWWAVRQRIVRSQARHLGNTEGPLVSAMVLGARSVDLPNETRDCFVQVGLAHALAASGFQVSLILAAVLALTQPLPDSQRAAIGCGALLIFGLLSGFEPSVFRAILMGIASLFALVTSRKTQPVGLLLLVAVTLLLINPLWIWDLGFQLSFLATLGLVISVPTFMTVLDWLPPRLATLIAVPLAATLWTLPLQLYRFGIVPTYGLLANILATSFLTVLTIGGFISAVVAILVPQLGSSLASVLYYPAHWLIGLIKLIAELPGSTLALGTISVLQLLVLYGLLLGVWLWRPQNWQGALAIALAVIALPIWQVQNQRFQVTLFDSVTPPIMVIQQPGATLLLNTGDRLTASQSVIPFLRRQGVRHVDLAIATATWPRLQEGWQTLLHRIPVQALSVGAGQDNSNMAPIVSGTSVELRPLQPQQPLTLGQISLTFLRTRPAVVLMQIQQRHWLLVTNQSQFNWEAWLQTMQLPHIDVLWWVGPLQNLPVTLEPDVAVLSTRDRATSPLPAATTYWTTQTGAIQWTPEGFRSTLTPDEQTPEVF